MSSEPFKADKEDWEEVEAVSRSSSGLGEEQRCIIELRDRVAALEAAPARFIVRNESGEYLRAGTPVYLAAPAAVMPSDEELWKIWNDTQEEGTIEHFRALFAYGYEQGLAAGRAEQQAVPEDPSAAQSDPAMTALALPKNWYPDFADWLERQMPEGTVIGDPLWWASRIADWLIAKAALGPEPSPSPAPGLVEVVIRALQEPCLGWDEASRNGIRAVARWLLKQGRCSTAALLEQEANR
jgi:hypothetical protein